MNVEWSDLAISDFEQNIEFLYQNWTEQVVYDFIFETERVIELISVSPTVFRKNTTAHVHLVTITKQITLIYQVEKNSIQLLRFWNNFKDPTQIVLK